MSAVDRRMLLAGLACGCLGIWQIGWAAEAPVADGAAAQTEEAPTTEAEEEPSTEPAAQADAAPAPLDGRPTGPASGPVAASSGLITVDFKDADIRQVLRVIALKSGVDIVAGPDVEAVVTIKLTNVPWEQALDIILRTYGFSYDRQGDVIRVLTREAVEQEALATEVFPLSYANAEEVMPIVKEMLSDRGKVKFDARTNTVVITDLPATLFQMRRVVGRLDQQTPQVHIDSKIIETKLTKDENFGIEWFDSIGTTIDPAIMPTTFPWPGGNDFGNVGSTFLPRPGSLSPTTGASLTKGRVPETGGQFTFGTIDTGSLAVTLNMLKQRVNTNIISHPTIVTLNNQTALVQVGEDINIPNFQIDSSSGLATVTGFKTRKTGVIMEVTPHVNPEREIVLDLKPEITEVGATFDSYASGVSFPRFTVQKAETHVRLKDGETLVIGGLVKRKVVVTDNRVPILGDIPLLGALFTNRREASDPHQDLLIFLSVRLIEDAAPQPALAQQPEEKP
ncbi:MAG: secretin and TonB N-terminal domain-containing protein [Candidatus Omnitrophica bacterium]|nr:secretin and TonB N-terminal domain-containing protein [Candidatus Omnitrophota bacterium]